MPSVLRPLQNHHFFPFIQGFKFTTAATPSAVLDIGSEEADVARVLAGAVTVTLDDVLAREGISIITPGANVASGSKGVFDTDHSGAVITAVMLNAAGSGDDGTGHMLSLGWESSDTNRIDPGFNVKNRAYSPRLMAFRCTSAGAVALGKAQASAALASSVTTLTFADAFGRDCIVVASPIAAACKACRITAATPKLASIETYDPVGGALEDNAFYCVVLGWDNPGEQTGVRRTINVPQIKPRIEVFKIDGSGGALDIGSDDATLTVNGTGDYSLTFTKAFEREPIVVVSGKSYYAQLAANATSAGCQILSFNHSGSAFAAVHDDIAVMVIGYDYETEV